MQEGRKCVFVVFSGKAIFVHLFPLYFTVFWHIISSIKMQMQILWFELKRCHFTCNFNICKKNKTNKQTNKQLNSTPNVTYDLLSFTWRYSTRFDWTEICISLFNRSLSAVNHIFCSGESPGLLLPTCMLVRFFFIYVIDWLSSF